MPVWNPSVTGIVAVGQIPYVNRNHQSAPSVVLGDDTLCWDASSKRLGVGISVASGLLAKVHVTGDGAPAAWPLALRVDSGPVFAGDYTLSTYQSSDPVHVEICAPAASSRSRALRVGPGALTVAGGELYDVFFDLSHTVTFSGSGMALQRAINIDPPTYAFTTAQTVTKAASLYVNGGPIPGTNTTFDSSAYSFGSFGIYCVGGSHFGQTSAISTPTPALSCCFTSPMNLASGYEWREFNVAMNGTLSWSGSPPATYRAVVLCDAAITLSGAGTITNAATVYIAAAPAASGLTITNSYALWVAAGAVRLDGELQMNQWKPGSATLAEVIQRVNTTGSPNILKLTGAAHTTLSNAEASDLIVAANRTVQFGQNTLLATQRCVQILAPTYSSSVATKTITDAVTLDINAAPAVGTNVLITNAMALRVQAGQTQLLGGLKVDGNVGFFNTAPIAKQTSGADLTNNVTSGGTNDTIANYTDLTTYANDAAAIRNDIYQLARKLKQVNDALRAYGLLT